MGRDKSAKDYEGSAAMSTKSGARSSVRLTGRGYVAFVTTCRSCGKFAVFVDGKKRKTVDTYSAHTHHRVSVKLYSSPRNSRRHIVLKVLGTHAGASHGDLIQFDAIAVGNDVL